MVLRRAVWLALITGVLIYLPLAAAQETPPQRVRVSDEVMRGVLVRKVAPVYPPLARQALIQGTVMLKVVIDKSGNVSDMQLVSGHPMLAPAAIEAVKQWKYQPYLLNGEAVEVETNVQVIFRIADGPEPTHTAQEAPGTAPGEVPGGAPGGPVSGHQVVGGVIGGIVTAAPSDAVRVSEAVMRAFRLNMVTPDYPPAALEQRVSGPVVLSARISPSGDVESIRFLSGPPMLAQAAIEAVKQWKYKPYLLNGEAVKVETTVGLSFALVDQNGLQGIVSEPPPNQDMPPRIAIPQRIRVSSGVSQGLLEHKVNPEYPPDAREQNIQGVVVLKVNIDKQGKVYAVELVSGHPLLAPAAMEAVRQWTYKPYLLNGIPVEVETQVRVNFMLAN